MASSEIFFNGVLILKPNLIPTASICLKVQFSLYSPRGAIPPFFIVEFLLGIILSISISETTPSPLHFLHAP